MGRSGEAHLFELAAFHELDARCSRLKLYAG